MDRQRSDWDFLSSQDYLIDPDLDVNDLIQENNVKRFERSEAYVSYLNSPYWQKVRSALKQRAKDKCEGCGAPNPGGSRSLQVHHLRYPKRYTELEHLDALTLLCPECHRQLHH